MARFEASGAWTPPWRWVRRLFRQAYADEVRRHHHAAMWTTILDYTQKESLLENNAKAMAGPAEPVEVHATITAAEYEKLLRATGGFTIHLTRSGPPAGDMYANLDAIQKATERQTTPTDPALAKNLDNLAKHYDDVRLPPQPGDRLDIRAVGAGPVRVMGEATVDKQGASYVTALRSELRYRKLVDEMEAVAVIGSVDVLDAWWRGNRDLIDRGLTASDRALARDRYHSTRLTLRLAKRAAEKRPAPEKPPRLPPSEADSEARLTRLKQQMDELVVLGDLAILGAWRAGVQPEVDKMLTAGDRETFREEYRYARALLKRLASTKKADSR